MTLSFMVRYRGSRRMWLRYLILFSTLCPSISFMWAWPWGLRISKISRRWTTLNWFARCILNKLQMSSFMLCHCSSLRRISIDIQMRREIPYLICSILFGSAISESSWTLPKECVHWVHQFKSIWEELLITWRIKVKFWTSTKIQRQSNVRFGINRWKLLNRSIQVSN